MPRVSRDDLTRPHRYRAVPGDASPLTLVRSISPSPDAATLSTVVDDAPVPLPKLSIRETAEIAAWWSAVWFLANWSLNAALALASVSSVTILSSTTSFFTLTLGKAFGVEDVTRAKIFSALAS